MSLPENVEWNWSDQPEHEVGMIAPFVFGRILDYGCGTGRLTRPLGAVGYDPDPEAIAYARELGGEYSTVPPCDFDSAFSVLVFQHLPGLAVSDIISFVYPAGVPVPVRSRIGARAFIVPAYRG